MKMGIYSIFDIKAAAYHVPFVAANDAVAVRLFKRACNQEGDNFHAFAADYTIFQIGSFDDQTAAVEPNGALLPLANGLQMQVETVTELIQADTSTDKAEVK